MGQRLLITKLSYGQPSLLTARHDPVWIKLQLPSVSIQELVEGTTCFTLLFREAIRQVAVACDPSHFKKRILQALLECKSFQGCTGTLEPQGRRLLAKDGVEGTT